MCLGCLYLEWNWFKKKTYGSASVYLECLVITTKYTKWTKLNLGKQCWLVMILSVLLHQKSTGITHLRWMATLRGFFTMFTCRGSSVRCENMPIQIYWKFYHQKMKIFRIKIRYFSYFCLKHRLWGGYSFNEAVCLFVCVEVLRPCQPNGVMWSAVSLPNHTFSGQA